MFTHANIHQWTICLDSHCSQNLIALVRETLGKELLSRCGCLQPGEPHWLLGWNLQWLKHRSDAQHRCNCVLRALWMWFTLPFLPNHGTDLSLWNNDPSHCFSCLPNVMWATKVACSEFFSWDGWVRMTSNTFFRDPIYLFITFQSSYQHDITTKAF